MLTLAVLLHNIPEGMVIGVLYAGLASDSAQLTAAGALTLSLGIAIQNFPEGVIVSMPLRTEGFSKPKAFGYGLLTGVVEPLGALLMILAAHILVPALPYLLGFAAGAMIYVVVEELIPEMSAGGPFRPRNTVFCARLYNDDGFRCGFRLTKRAEEIIIIKLVRLTISAFR